MKAAALFWPLALVAGCAQIPKSYEWDVVDCTYQRGVDGDRSDVKATCRLEGRAELGDLSLPFR